MDTDSNEKAVNLFGDVENIHLTQEDWCFRWKQNQIAFHSSSTNTHLLKYENKLLVEKNSRVFVPLCGKSVDLVYFADKDHDVFGCEFVEKAVKDFFAEQSLDYTFQDKDFSSGRVKEFKATSKRITIWQCDLFTLSSLDVGKFDAIWDKGSMIAIDPLKRSDYVQLMHDLLRKNGRYLLDTLLIPGKSKEYSGPPYSLSQEDIEQFFGNFFDITLLEERQEGKFAKTLLKHRHINIIKRK